MELYAPDKMKPITLSRRRFPSEKMEYTIDELAARPPKSEKPRRRSRGAL